jgi:hypothetical protein
MIRAVRILSSTLTAPGGLMAVALVSYNFKKHGLGIIYEEVVLVVCFAQVSSA